MIQIKRAYEPESRKDGYRVFIDRLWPRGLKKSEFHFDEWDKELAPSPQLRIWFAHKAENWQKFRTAYKKELKSADGDVRTKLKELKQLAGKSTVTLLYAARDERHNHALVLKEVIDDIR
jgi:uncharacterized protein YeaO (DUF488 family)